jgi:hypothetical protein
MEFLLIVLTTIPMGDVEQGVYAITLSAWECEVQGVIFESFSPRANWYCEVNEVQE